MKQSTLTPFFVFGGLAIIPPILYFFKFNGSLSDDSLKWAQFGSYLSGFYGLISFLMVAYSNRITWRQFASQNEDNLFFKLVEAYHGIINSVEIDFDGTKFKSHQVVKEIAEAFSEEMDLEAVKIAKEQLCEDPKFIDYLHGKILHAVCKSDIEKSPHVRDQFIQAMDNRVEFHERWEYLKYFLPQGSLDVNDALRAAGSVYFYNIPFERRSSAYQRASSNVLNNYGSFLDGYFRRSLALFDFAFHSPNRKRYKPLLDSMLTKNDKLILFYLSAYFAASGKICQSFPKMGVFDSLFEASDGLIDMPDEKKIRTEIDAIFGCQSDTSKQIKGR